MERWWFDFNEGPQKKEEQPFRLSMALQFDRYCYTLEVKIHLYAIFFLVVEI